MMAKIKTTILLICFPLLLAAQQQAINSNSDTAKGEREPAKQQINWVGHGTAGNCQFWNFNYPSVSYNRNSDNQRKTGDEWLTGRERETSHTIYLSGDSLVCTGYENEKTTVRYSQPQVLLRFPIDYRKSSQEEFRGRGKFGDQLEMTFTGNISTTVDGWGQVILPGGKLLENVFRVHIIIRSLRETAPLSRNFDINAPVSNERREEKPAGDSGDPRHSALVIESIYRWYVSGSRYPVFETQETRIVYEKEPVVEQRSTFLYAAGEQGRNQ